MMPSKRVRTRPIWDSCAKTIRGATTVCYFNDSPSAEREDKIIRPVTGEVNQIDVAASVCHVPALKIGG